MVPATSDTPQAPICRTLNLEPPGTGARYRGMYDMDERLRDCEKPGIARHMKFKDVELLKRCADISAADKELIFCSNALKLLGAA